MPREKFYITTAISYPNGEPHIGHAYELIATDALARFQRLDGKDVFFLTGTDEHGIKMLQTARREGTPLRELADRNSAGFKRDGAKLSNASNDDFIRTTEQRHHAASQAIWQRDGRQWRHLPGQLCRLVFGARRGLFRRGRDRAAATTACAASPQGTPVEWVEEESYFFRLSAYQDRLLDHLRGASRLHRPAGAAQRGRQLRQVRA